MSTVKKNEKELENEKELMNNNMSEIRKKLKLLSINIILN